MADTMQAGSNPLDPNAPADAVDLWAELERERSARLAAQQALLSKNQELEQVTADLRRAADDLAGREARLRQVINTANDAFLATDIFGVINEWNGNAEKLFGWSAPRIVGRRLDALLRPGKGGKMDPNNVLSMVFNAVGEDQRGQMVGVHEDGHSFPVEVSISTMVDDDSFVFNAFMHDASAKIKMQKQLTQGEKLQSIGRLAAGIAHEINTPTQYVGDNIAFLRDSFATLGSFVRRQRELAEGEHDCKKCDAGNRLTKALDDLATELDISFIVEEVPQALAQALEGIQAVTQIVRSMKEFAHPGVDSVTGIDINHALESTITVCRSEWKYVATVERDLDTTLPPVPCVPGEINQVILNLIVNAAQAIEAAGKRAGDADPAKRGLIRVSTRLDGDFAELSVADNGTGIPESARSKIFDPFFTTKEVGKGSGQGLAIAHAVIVERHGGELRFETEMGRGTRFIIRLPLTLCSTHA
jgi:PAS domain S-box-containing protein